MGAAWICDQAAHHPACQRNARQRACERARRSAVADRPRSDLTRRRPLSAAKRGRVNRVTQHPVQAFLAALAAVATLSIMGAVMKHLVLVIGIFAVSVWRSVANFLVGAILYLPRRGPWPSKTVMRVHIFRGVIVTVMAFLFFWGIGRVPL